MKKIDWETYQTAYQKADQETKQILDSTIIPNCVINLIETKTLDKSQKNDLVNLFCDYTLNLYTVDDVITTMKQMGIPSSKEAFDLFIECKNNKVTAGNQLGQTITKTHESDESGLIRIPPFKSVSESESSDKSDLIHQSSQTDILG